MVFTHVPRINDREDRLELTHHPLRKHKAFSLVVPISSMNLADRRLNNECAGVLRVVEFVGGRLYGLRAS